MNAPTKIDRETATAMAVTAGLAYAATIKRDMDAAGFDNVRDLIGGVIWFGAEIDAMMFRAAAWEMMEEAFSVLLRHEETMDPTLRRISEPSPNDLPEGAAIATRITGDIARHAFDELTHGNLDHVTTLFVIVSAIASAYVATRWGSFLDARELVVADIDRIAPLLAA